MLVTHSNRSTHNLISHTIIKNGMAFDYNPLVHKVVLCQGSQTLGCSRGDHLSVELGLGIKSSLNSSLLGGELSHTLPTGKSDKAIRNPHSSVGIQVCPQI